MIQNQEEKFNKVLEEVTGTLSEQSFFNTFLKLYSDDWKRIKINYSKFNRSKKFGKTIPLQRPEEALRRVIRIFLNAKKKS